MHRVPHTSIVFVALAFLAMSCCACAQTNYFVPGLSIDAEQHLNPIGPKSLTRPAADSYYMFFHTATKLTTVNHLARQSGSADVRRLLYLEADHDVLERTVKTDEIVTGPFGAVTVEKTCFYNRPISQYVSSVKVLLQSAVPEIGREIPDRVTKAPVEVPQLTSAAIVRIFGSGPELAFGSGNYEANGTIGTIDSGRILNGVIQGGASIVSARAPWSDKIRKASGLAVQFEIEKYLRSKRISLLTAAGPNERTFVVLVYGFGKLIRQDSLEDGRVVSSRYLKPVVTQEEDILTHQCDQQLRQQQSSGKPTVQ